jgi:hypothetical protein
MKNELRKNNDPLKCITKEGYFGKNPRIICSHNGGLPSVEEFTFVLLVWQVLVLQNSKEAPERK